MGRKYWLDRERSALTMARNASTAEARLLHFQLAGRYSLKASASALSIPTGEARSKPEPSLPGPAGQAGVTSFFGSGGDLSSIPAASVWNL
jgi:hypothetical protein